MSKYEYGSLPTRQLTTPNGSTISLTPEIHWPNGRDGYQSVYAKVSFELAGVGEVVGTLKWYDTDAVLEGEVSDRKTEYLPQNRFTKRVIVPLHQEDWEAILSEAKDAKPESDWLIDSIVDPQKAKSDKEAS